MASPPPATYSDLTALAQSTTFQNRVVYALGKFANFILGEPTTAPDHANRLRFAQHVQADPNAVMLSLMPQIIQQTAVINAGANISDTDLQTTVESVAGVEIDQAVDYPDYYEFSTSAATLKRIQIALSRFSETILSESPTTPNHANRFAWARGLASTLNNTAAQVAFPTSQDPNVNQTLWSTPDNLLQSAVEAQTALLYF